MPANDKSKLDPVKIEAVKLRLRGVAVADTAKQTGLSAPTIIKCHKLFLQGGWQALVDQKSGRSKGQGSLLKPSELEQFMLAMQCTQQFLWSTEKVADYVDAQLSISLSERTASHLCKQIGLLWGPWSLSHLVNVAGRRALKRAGELPEDKGALYFAYCRSITLALGETKVKRVQLALQTPKHKRLWSIAEWPTESWLVQSLTKLLDKVPPSQKGKRPVTLVLVGLDVTRAEHFKAWAENLRELEQLQLLLIKPQHSLLPG